MSTIKCFLCKKEDSIENSHIIPKFVYRFLKKTGTGRLRSIENINKPLEDGVKKPFLCSKCENKFNMFETYFSSQIFYPVIKERKVNFKYDNRFKGFIISVLWRIIKDTLNNKWSSEKLKEIEKEYSNFLNCNIPLVKYDNLHCFIGVDILEDFKFKPLVYYMARAVDSGVIISKENAIEFIYIKMPRFIFLLPISENIKGNELINTKVNDEGLYVLSNTVIDSDIIGSYIIKQALYFEKENAKKSKVQKQKTKERTEKIKREIVKKDLGKIFKYINEDEE